MSKTPMIQVAFGELYVFGKIINRHTNKPWLFSITDVYKACESTIKREAVKKGRKPDTYFNSKRPGSWLRTKDEYGISKSAKSTRNRMNRHGIYCGFGKDSDTRRRASLDKTDAHKRASVVDYKTLSDRDLVICVVKGGSTKGNNKITQGTYVCQNWIT